MNVDACIVSCTCDTHVFDYLHNILYLYVSIYICNVFKDVCYIQTFYILFTYGIRYIFFNIGFPHRLHRPFVAAWKRPWRIPDNKTPENHAEQDLR